MKTHIENLVSKILSEEIDKKSKSMVEKMGGEWTEIEVKEKLYGNQKKLDVAQPKGKLTAADFKKLSRVKNSTKKEMDETETEEGNLFTGALANAKKKGDKEFKVDGKTYQVKEEKKWIQKTEMKKGGLHKKLNVPEDEKIPQAMLKSLKKELMKRAEGDKKLNSSDSKLLKQVNLALTLKDIKKESINSNLKLTEEQLIDLIEDIVLEQKKQETKEKNNINVKQPEGLKKTNKVLDATEKENEDYAKEVVEKMRNYLKDGSKGKFEMNPDYFPKGNGELKKMDKKAYIASDAVGEYIENFARAAGLEELVYDEIEPHEDWVKDNIKGSARTGNNPKWGNAVETDLGEKLYQKSQKKPYSTEKRKGSYKRQSQPIDKAGEHDGKKSIDDMFAKLESKENKSEKLISEEMQVMKNLISYNRKTQ